MSEATPAPALEAQGLVREYGPVVAVRGVDLALQPGESLAIFGPNGAGKSSLLGMLGGVMRPTRGSVLIGGAPVKYDDPSWRSQVGVLSHRGYLYGHLTASENLAFYGSLFGLDDLGDRIPARLEQVGLSDRAHWEVRRLSHGMRQRLALARALLHDPDVVLLDEPFTGLDPSAASVLRTVLSELRDGLRTLVIVTHNLKEGLALASRAAIQVAGSLAWEGSPSSMPLEAFENHYHAVVEGRA